MFEGNRQMVNFAHPPKSLVHKIKEIPTRKTFSCIIYEIRGYFVHCGYHRFLTEVYSEVAQKRPFCGHIYG